MDLERAIPRGRLLGSSSIDIRHHNTRTFASQTQRCGAANPRALPVLIATWSVSCITLPPCVLVLLDAPVTEASPMLTTSEGGYGRLYGGLKQPLGPGHVPVRVTAAWAMRELLPADVLVGQVRCTRAPKQLATPRSATGVL